ncbi:erythromycin esterase family protein [Nonomuraea sp. NPDC048826]|uniref:erythromycin esterase family protein n=1 Tax=Nonomuraea sp. NPDC048826 TaxID=3364347 RepID=UPI00371377BC
MTEVTGWLASRAIPLAGLDPRSPAADLEPLREVLDGVRVVGLGEATHGTREFFLLKHRLLRFLVEELGFTVLAMEASVSAAEALDAYVLGGPGDPERLLADLGFWTWHTREMLAVVEWMREHNRTAMTKVRFAGIDPQFPAASLRWLRDHLGDRADDLLGPLEVLGETRLGVTGPLSPTVEAAARRLLDHVLEVGGPDNEPPGARPWSEGRGARGDVRGADIPGGAGRGVRGVAVSGSAGVSHEAEGGAGVSDEAACEGCGDADLAGGAVAHAVTVWQFATLMTRPRRDADAARTVAAARDRFMADNVDRLPADPAAKIAVWAHNGHVSAGHYGNDGGIPAMGHYLRRRHGDGYYALGLLFGEGEFRARRLRFGKPDVRRPPVGHRVPATAKPTMTEFSLSAACPRDHLVDLRGGPRPDSVEQWLGQERSMRAYGGVAGRFAYKLAFTPTVLGHDFDGLAYIAHGTCSTPL